MTATEFFQSPWALLLIPAVPGVLAHVAPYLPQRAQGAMGFVVGLANLLAGNYLRARNAAPVVDLQDKPALQLVPDQPQDKQDAP